MSSPVHYKDIPFLSIFNSRQQDQAESVEYGVRLTYMQAWRAKEAALELVRGDPIQSYAKLPSYFHILEATYPGSHIRLHKSEDNRFLYAFVALFTSIKTWEYCKPIVVVDETFLKGAYKGTLLTANTLDAAGSILPLAYAIVDSENDASWRWFFEQFRDAFGQRLEMCIVFDRHASIIKATSRVYDEVPHFTFEKIDKRIKDYLLNIGYNKWSHMHAEVNRTWMMTSNIAESVNSRTRHVKVLTVLHLLEFMRQLVQKWNNNNRSKATFSGFHLGKKYENILRRNKTASEKLRVVETNKYVYTVLDGITQFTFQMDPLPDESTWNIPTHVLEEVVLPPHGKRPPGRPKNKIHTQLREDEFKKVKIICSNCGQQDHNRKT
ncbi:hypothetical protein KY290_010277 [Solanum tuberosum]|uniref:MULE transposase domain-containing protein n=1 Tax=Solanum tuberosum TaxID=4113 RepID=A0ABQ7VXB6_SOLTU|nr:hypothetical protein KY289_010663 [Solanum tuberosum]KAH0773140.1 hypothetical protein KY290_010277 [Solanum tuberosum]